MVAVGNENRRITVSPDIGLLNNLIYQNRLELQQTARKQGRWVGLEEQVALEKRSHNLSIQIQKFNAEARKYIVDEAIDEVVGSILYGDDTFEPDWDIDLEAVEVPPLNLQHPATQLIALPSAIPSPERFSGIQTLRARELTLRRGQANDSLSGIRQIVGQLSFQWKKGVRLAPDKARTMRMRKSIEAIHRKLSLQAKIYQHIRLRMQGLGMDEGELNTVYQPLSPGDIAMSKAIKGPNERGESQAQLSWIWTSFPGVTEDQNYLTECESKVWSHWRL